MFEAMLKEAEQKMDKAVQSVEHDLATLRSGRASTSIIDGLQVDAYGTKTPIKQLGNISTPDAATILIQPWDQGVLGAIEKAIHGANVGLTPNNDGKVIRLNVPQLTEDARKGIVKKAHEMAEHGRVSIRNIRRGVNDEMKKAEKAHKISEDECKRFLDGNQKKTDAHIKKIDEILARKEAEIMKV